MNKFFCRFINFSSKLRWQHWTKLSRSHCGFSSAALTFASKFSLQTSARKIHTFHYLLIPCGSLLAVALTEYNQYERWLLKAAQFGRVGEIKKVLAQGVDVNTRHPLGWTALHVAAMNGRLDAVRLLLDSGADPNLGDQYMTDQQTATALGKHSLRVAQERDEDFNHRLTSSQTFLGFTALHYAMLTDNFEIVKLLLEKGADPTIENALGHTPDAYAKDQEIKLLAQKYSPKFIEMKLRKEAEERRRFPLEDRLKQVLVGQDNAITVVAAAIRRKENGWSDDDHPLVFLFLGSSGIGKTELAKQVALYIHKNKPGSFVRLDMSEYQEKHSVAKMIGAPPGYLGHDDGGQLTSNLRKYPNAVVLFDEVDKAHPDVLTVLLQLFDEGRLTDGKGQTISCKDAIFVMTSNLASDEIASHGLQLRADIEQIKKERLSSNTDSGEVTEQITITRNFKDSVVKPILKHHFKRDEFLGRINEIVYFLPFSRSELNRLVLQELQYWAKKAQEKHSVDLVWENEVIDVLVQGYDVQYGVRSIKYEVDRRVISQLALAHEQGMVTAGCTVQIGVSQPSQSDGVPSIVIHVRPQGKSDRVSVTSYIADKLCKLLLSAIFHSSCTAKFPNLLCKKKDSEYI